MVEADRDFLEILTHRGWDGHPETLREFLAFRFLGLPTRLFAGVDDFTDSYRARDKTDSTMLWLSREQDGTTVALRDSNGPVDMEDHAMRYRRHTHWLAQWVSRSSPNPVWVTDPEGLVLWANRAYGDLARDRGYAELGEASWLDDLEPERGFADREQRRYHLVFKDGRPDRWMDVTETIEQGMHLYHAVDVTAVVQGEAAQHTFVQTLTKTFAQLSIGLAIFDRSRQLALFNPALIDLTGLSAEYLLGRPECLTFFDSLREGGIMPEPRNYQTWRKKISDLILDAENDRYQETWSLATGNTYRITGRPHPNGAVAFLIEDISAEVTLTRRFREQLDMSQSVLESLDDAVAVFSPQGMLSYTNSAYRRLWSLPDGASTIGISVLDASRHWQEKCSATPVWGDFRDFVVGFEERADWDATVYLCDGQPLECRFRPLQGGASLATFRAAVTAPSAEYQGFG